MDLVRDELDYFQTSIKRCISEGALLITDSESRLNRFDSNLFRIIKCN